jgi:hypothetical protein
MRELVDPAQCCLHQADMLNKHVLWGWMGYLYNGEFKRNTDGKI